MSSKWTPSRSPHQGLGGALGRCREACEVEQRNEVVGCGNGHGIVRVLANAQDLARSGCKLFDHGIIKSLGPVECGVRPIPLHPAQIVDDAAYIQTALRPRARPIGLPLDHLNSGEPLPGGPV